MNATFTNSDLIQEVHEQTGLSLSDSKQAVDTVFSTIEKALSRNDRYVIRGVVTFEMKERRSRKGWDFENKHHIKIDPQVVPTATVSEILLKKLRRKIDEK